MKRQCFESLPKNNNIKNQAYNRYAEILFSHFKDVQSLEFASSPVQKLQEFKEKSSLILSTLKKMQSLRQIKRKHATPIYEFYLKEQLRSLNSIKKITDVNVKILRVVKPRVNISDKDNKNRENYVKIGVIGWKQLWERICRQCPEIGLNSNSIQSIVRIVKKHFDENNAIEVWQYFRKKNRMQMQRKMIQIFIRITKNTEKQIFKQYLNNLLEYYQLNKITKSKFMQEFLSATKLRKLQNQNEDDASFNQTLYSHLNNAFLQSFTEIETNKKGNNQLIINRNSAYLLESLLGKSNKQGSIYILENVFSLIRKLLKPLESNNNCLGFLYIFFKYLNQRLEKEQKTRLTLNKLIAKIKDRKAQEKQDEEEEDEDEEINANNQKEQQAKNQQLEKEEAEDADVFAQLTKQGFLFEEEQEEEEQQLKLGTDQQKKAKLQTKLRNQVTEDIINLLLKYLEDGIFQVLYYMISKRFVPHILKYIFRIFPSMAIKSFDTLEKASQIPNINEEALIKNMIVGVQSMFTDQNRSAIQPASQQQKNYVLSVKSLMRILEKAYNCRQILDVWPLYETVFSKIPLLDQKDMENISEEHKELFLNTFGLNHDRFYEDYSEHIVEAFKRFLREGQFLEEKDEKKYTHGISQLYCNSHKFMRKRLLGEVMEIISEKPNMIAISYLLECHIPQRQQEILRNQISQINAESEQSKELRQQLTYALTKKLSLQELKPWMRKFAKQNFYEPIKLYILFNVGESIDWNPVDSSLKFLYSEDNINISFNLTISKVKSNLKGLSEYQQQLIEQVKTLAQQMTEKLSDSNAKQKDYIQLIVDTYNNTRTIKDHEIRKNLHQLFTIINLINSALEPYLLVIKQNKSQMIELIGSDTRPLKITDTSKSQSLLSVLLSRKQILNDPKIVKIISSLVTTQHFQAEDILDGQYRKITKQVVKIKNHELSGYVNRIRYGNQFISRSRMYMAANMNAEKIAERVAFDQQILIQLFKLLTVNGNQVIKDLMSMFKLREQIHFLKEMTLQLVRQKIQNRILIKRIGQIIRFLIRKQVGFSNQEIIFLMDYHVALLQSHDSKIRQNAIQSLKKTVKVFQYHPPSRNMHQMMAKYLGIEKMEMIWLIYAIIIFSSHVFIAYSQLSEETLKYFLQKMEKLLLDESRSIRRMALYLYSIFIREFKKNHTSSQVVQFEGQCKEKELEDFLETGFLRPQFYDKQLKDRKIHKQIPLSSYKVKTLQNFEYGFFEFLIANEANALKFIKNFHSDMIGSPQQLMSALQSSMLSVDLFSAATKALEKIFFFIKTRDMTTSRIEVAIGSRLFKYLCIQDSIKGFKFFRNIRNQVQRCLVNLQSLDNQALILTFSVNLLNAYQQNFKGPIADIQEFLSNFFREIIKKSSGAIFKKVIKLFFGKTRRKEGLEFLKEMVEKMINEKTKVSRASQILIKLEDKTLRIQQKILKVILGNQIELQNSFLQTLLCDILMYPETYPINITDVNSSKIISLEKYLSEKMITKFTENYCLVSIKQINNFIISNLKRMLDSQEPQKIKTVFNLINILLRICNMLLISEESVQLMIEVICLGIKIANSKKQIQLQDVHQFKRTLSQIVSIKIPEQAYQKLFMAIMDTIDPTIKKSSDFFHSLISSPVNIIELPEKLTYIFIGKALEFEKRAGSFKQILIILSTFFTYSKIQKQQLDHIITIIQGSQQSKAEIKQKKIIVYQAYVLANNIELDRELVRPIMKSQRDKRNIWARQMLLHRGRRQYFDNYQTYEIWKQIKQISNPYHYIA